jgi:antitoxin CptB
MNRVAAPDDLLGERELSKLKWRCRRGLLENDLFIQRFFDRFEASLTVRQAAGLQVLTDLADNDLLDLLLARRPAQDLVAADALPLAQEVLDLLRSRPNRMTN